jgi:hypothetical protein
VDEAFPSFVCLNFPPPTVHIHVMDHIQPSPPSQPHFVGTDFDESADETEQFFILLTYTQSLHQFAETQSPHCLSLRKQFRTETESVGALICFTALTL